MRLIHAMFDFLLNCLWHTVRYYRWWILMCVLLALHFLFGLPIWLFWLTLGIWLLRIILLALFVKFANYCGNLPVVQKPNKNPYSASDARVFPDVEGSGPLEERQEQQS